MEIPQIIAKINIKPVENKKIFIEVNMPIWIRKDRNGMIWIKMPLLGLESFAQDMMDLDFAIKESINIFFKTANKYGKGFTDELTTLGWQKKKGNTLRYKDKKSSFIKNKPESFQLPGDNPIYAELLKTGIQKKVSLRV
jgi:hypothetical protein